jgi:hypothetical protein
MPSPEPNSQVFALVGAFDSPGELVHACEELRDAGFTSFDAHTPFPVHGIERAMGLRASRVSWLALAGGILGGVGGLALQVWTMGFDYPQNISGKPLIAWQAYVPVTFELTILLAAFGTFFGMWGLNRLPRLFHPVMRAASFDRASDDRFLLSVEAADPQFDLEKVRDILKAQGAREIEEVAP